MKRIEKRPEPDAFADWDGRSGEIKDTIHAALMAEQGNICCYCEQRVSKNDSHIEHFRPQSKYASLRLDYGNLHCSCQRELEPGEPRHCGHEKGNWFDDDLMISPLECDCEDRFMFTGYGEIRPRNDGDDAARETIGKLGLDLDKLRALRASALDNLLDLNRDEIRILLEGRPENGFLPFHTTIRQVLMT